MTLGEGDSLIIDYAEAEALTDLNDGESQLGDNARLLLASADADGVTHISDRQSSGADYQYYAGIAFEDISSSSNGGAIYGDSSSTIKLSNNGDVKFSGNSASSSVNYMVYGGAIYGAGSCTIELNSNNNVEFCENTALSHSGGAYGGAICGEWDGSITLNNNGSVKFRGNKSLSNVQSENKGGAIRGNIVTLSNNGSVEFSENSSQFGGALYGNTITLDNNGSVIFNRNSVSSFVSGGGVMGGIMDITITLSNNGSVIFSENKASSTAASDSYFTTYGGAIFVGNDSTIKLNNNGSVEFCKNSISAVASAYGGAIYGVGSCTIELNNNGNVEFRGNSVSSSDGFTYGGAIYVKGSLHIRNNDSVEFAGNEEKSGSTYRLRSIYAGEDGGVISLSVADGKSIKFRDSIYIASGNTFNLNEDYEKVKQEGDIIFTGATTVDDLYKVKGDVDGTDGEILASRTSEVYTMTNLYGGRLRVEDGAVYQGYGITVHEGSEATVLVKDATLNHSGYNLTFNSGTTLQAAGVSSITGNVVMLQGSQLALTVGAMNTTSAVLTLGTAMDLQGVNLLVEGAEYLLSGEYKLIADTGYNSDDWKTDVVQVNGCTAESLVWKNGVLTLICTNAANKAVDNGAIVGDTNANIVVGNGADATIAGTIEAGGEGNIAGHLIINDGRARLVEGGCIDGNVVFASAGTGAARELTVATDASVDAVVLSGSADGTVAVETGHEFAAGTLEGKGSMVKTGGGTMTHDGEASTVQGRVEIREGRFENTGNLVASQIEVSGGHLENQGTISHVELSAGKLSGCGVFDGLTMKGGVLVIGNSPGFQQYTDDLVAEGGELVFSVSGLENAATAESESWVSETYSQIDMGGYELSLGDDTTLTIALGGSLLENLEGEFNMQLFDNVGNIEDFTHDMLTLMLENTRFVVTTEAEGLCGNWEAGADLSLWVQGVQYRVEDSDIVLSGRFGAIPEPATTTLSLLALAALAARRRRK